MIDTSGFATTHVVVQPELPDMAVQSNLAERLQKRYGQVLSFFRFSGEPGTGPGFFQPKTFSIPRGIIPQNFSSLGFAVSQELGNKQTHRLTDIQALLQSDWGFVLTLTLRISMDRGLYSVGLESDNEMLTHLCGIKKYICVCVVFVD